MYSLHHINDDDNCTAHQKFTASSLLDTPLQTHMAGALTLYKTASSSDVSPSSTKRKLVEPWLSTVLHFISKVALLFRILQSEQIQKDRKSRTENLLMAGVLDTILY
ncbi:hypothetical protein BGX21_006366, partial [Mortierella sp. AD011]